MPDPPPEVPSEVPSDPPAEVSPEVPAVALDLADFDAVGVGTDIVIALRIHAIEHGIDAVAKVSAPDGWHRVVVTARQSGHVILGIRFAPLTASRRKNIMRALAERRWTLDDDHDGATATFPPGSEAIDAAFELLGVLSARGAPTDVRTVTAHDGNGNPVPLQA